MSRSHFDCARNELSLRYPAGTMSAQNYGVAVTPGVCEGVDVFVTVGVRVGEAVRVGVAVRDGVAVNEGVVEGSGVGASPCSRN